MKVEFYRHNIGEEEIARANEVLNSIFLTTGSVVKEFEESLSAYLGCGHTVGVTSCTEAMHISLLAYGIGPGDEVITTPMSFMATSNTVLQAGAMPVFVDVEDETGNIDASRIEEAITPRTKAIMPVHLYGQMCDMKAIRDIADRHGLVIIEDAAHCVEGIRDGVRPAQLSHAVCFSFYATKNITSGEGGAVSLNDLEIADRLRVLRLHGMTKGAEDRYSKRYQQYDMEALGQKCNMNNIQAALLIPQLRRIEERLERREEICRRYEEGFRGVEGVGFPEVLPGSKSARHLFTIRVPADVRDQMLWKLQDEGIGVAVNFKPIHLMKYYRRRFGFKEGDFPVAEAFGASTITLPLYPKLTDDEVDYVIDRAKACIKQCLGH